MAKRKKINKADEAYIDANLDKNSLEISEEIDLDQLVVAEYLKTARKEAIKEPARLRDSNGNIVGITLTEEMSMHPVAPPRIDTQPDYIYRKNKKK